MGKESSIAWPCTSHVKKKNELVFVEDRDYDNPPSPGSNTDISPPEEPLGNTAAIQDE